MEEGRSSFGLGRWKIETKHKITDGRRKMEDGRKH